MFAKEILIYILIMLYIYIYGMYYYIISINDYISIAKYKVYKDIKNAIILLLISQSNNEQHYPTNIQSYQILNP